LQNHFLVPEMSECGKIGKHCGAYCQHFSKG
jgi:hypothetical protein